MENLQCSYTDPECFDVIELSLTCLSGVDRKIMVSPQRLKQTKGIVSFGTIDRSIDNSFIFDEKSSFGVAKLDPASTRFMPWLSTNDKKVGGAMCELLLSSSHPNTCMSPRTAAVRQVDRLKDEFGFTIKSAFEAEFMIFEKDSTTPFNNITFKSYGRSDTWAGKEDALLETFHFLEQAGLPVESLMSEYVPAQFEITFCPREGVASPDSVMVMKEGLRAGLGKYGLVPTFMGCPVACPDSQGHVNGFHFNHSLWTADGKNAFVDVNAPSSQSVVTRHWIAGLIDHAPALTAFLCPTINCMIRLSDILSPTFANWGEEDRGTFLRLKTEKTNVYLENRLPSSACNPYFALAATIAAGMDGLARKLECPQQKDPLAPKLPTTMEEAVASLEGDTVLTQALGEDLVRAYLIMTKHNGDKKLDFDCQRHTYFHCI